MAAILLVTAITARGNTTRSALTIDVGDVTVDTIISPDDYTFTDITIPDFDKNAEPDEPRLPIKYITIAVPTYSNNYVASISASTKSEEIKLAYPLIPFKDCSTNDNPDSISYMPLTGSAYKAVANDAKVSVVNEYYLNGYEHFVTLGICPIAYNGVDNSVEVFKNLEIQFSYDSCSDTDLKFRPIEPKDGINMYDDTSFDYYECNQGALKMRKSTKAQSNSYSESITSAQYYVILLPEELSEAVDDLVKWKEEKGYNVEVQTYETIKANPLYAVGSRSECFDDASSIREWMRDFYSTYGAFQCLLIGDYRTSAPIRKFRCAKTDASDTYDSDENLDPTDAYFTDLVSDWDFVQLSSGIYVPSRYTLTFSPTISVGRLMCNSKQEIVNYTKKLRLYEAYPGRGDVSYLSKGVRVQHRDNLGTHTDSTCGSIFSSLSLEVANHIDNQADSYSELRPYPTDVLSDMNNAGLYSFQCHGDPVGFNIASITENRSSRSRYVLSIDKYRSVPQNGDTSYFDDEYNIGLDKMNNSDSPGILYSLSCKVAPFDRVTGLVTPSDNSSPTAVSICQEYNPASAYTVAGNFGGVAFLGNTRNGYFVTSSRLEKLFSSQLLNNSNIGIAENLSKIELSSNTSVKLRHNIIGDPDINIWLSSPSKIEGSETSSSGVWNIKSGNFNSGTYGIKFGKTYRRYSFSNASGNLSISMRQAIASNPTIGIGSIYISNPNYLPYIQLYTTGAEISNQVDSFILTSVNLGSSDNGYLPSLSIGENSEISLSSYTSISSENGITVSDGGTLNLTADEGASFFNDSIESGGILNISAQEVKLGAGFSIEKGGEMSISPRKSNL